MHHLVVIAALLVGCGAGTSPQLKVIGERESAAHEVVFVQVTNPASRTMRLTRLEYTFAADGGAQISRGDIALARDVQPGTAVVVEVPLDAPSDPARAMTLNGTLTTLADQIVRTFPVTASVGAGAPNLAR